MNPVLVVLDFAQSYARRYYPKPTGGFMTDEVNIQGCNWGSDEGRAQIEQFRADGLRNTERKTAVPM